MTSASEASKAAILGSAPQMPTSKPFNAASALARWRAWRNRIASIAERLRLLRLGDAGPDCTRRAAQLYLALFIPALAAVVLSNSKWNAIVNDTLLLVSSLEMVQRFSSLFSTANSNPLQALFDIFPSGLRQDAIPNLVGRALFGPGMHVDFFYVSSGILLAGAVATMARAAGLRWGVAAAAGMLLPLLVLPTFGMFPLVEHFYILWPITYYAAAGAVLVTALFWRIDGRSWMRSAALTAVIILVLLHLSTIQVLFMTLLAPAMIAMGIGALVASNGRREVAAKTACAAAIVVALAGAGIFHYLHALGTNTATYVFYRELMDFMNFSGPSLSVFLDDVGTVIKTPLTHNFRGSANIDGILVPLSQLGALHLAIFGVTREARIFGRTVLAWVVATALAIAVLHNFHHHTGLMYQGPDPRHFVPILWPYYAICLASLMFVLADGSLRLVSRTWSAARVGARYVPHALVVLVLAGPVAFLAANRILGAITPGGALGSQIFQTYLPHFKSHKRNPIVDYLETETAVGVGRSFRGSVFTMPTEYHRDTKPYGTWGRETTFAYARAYLGNDLGAFGLRHFNIPTLDQMTHNVTPQFYLTVRELLTRPGIDAYDRHFAVATRLNAPIMALLGVRYIIADYELPAGAQRLVMPIPEEARKVLEGQRLLKSPLRVYELPNPNIGNYSPTGIVRANTAKAAIQAMSSPTFDGRRTVVTDDPSIGQGLVPATGAAMSVRMGGVALRASSAGQSILALPVQYSHCWQIVSGSGASLFRANLMQLGVRFSGELRLELRQFFGPFWQSACRIADAADVERLRMADAAGAAAELRKTPGDGINLMPFPEALDRAIGNSAIASIEALGAPSAPPREFRLKAKGRWGEHYTVLKVANLSPGPHTLSLQVRAGGASRMALQLKDEAGNGVFADYLLSRRIAWAHRLGQSDGLHATAEKVDAEWLQLTATTALTTATGTFFVHLAGGGSNFSFAPRGETITIRAVKLERGETATPYPGVTP